jgi:hypothetical protein
MLKIKDRMMVPKGMYDYTVEQTGVRFESHGFGSLVVKVREHLAANDLPLPLNLGDVIEEDWCKRREEWCLDDSIPRPKGVGKEEWSSLSELIAKVAIGGADALATISKALGIRCSGCSARHKIIREMRRLGFSETLKRLKQTFHA